MTTDYGYDMWGTTDISPTLQDIGGDAMMPQVICRRLFTDPGSLLSAPDETTINLWSYLSAGIQADTRGIAQIKGAISGAVLADPRIYSALIDVTWDPPTETLTVSVAGQGATGPFRLTLAVDSVTVRLLGQ